MGEEVLQFEVVSNDAGMCGGFDETDKSSIPTNHNNEMCIPQIMNENCDVVDFVNCNDDTVPLLLTDIVNNKRIPPSPPPLILTVPQNSNHTKTHDNSYEKVKKWYNISFMHRTGSTNRNQSNAHKNKGKMDNRHSWHLNDSVEM